MSRKNVLQPFKLFDAVDVTTDQTSRDSDISYLDNVGLIVEWSGASPIGVFYVECANVALADSATNWQALDFGSQISITGNSGSHVININQNPFSKIRVRYATTSGSGTLTATIVAKMVG